MRLLTAIQIILFSLVFGQNTGYSDAFINIGTSSRSIAVGQSVVALPKNIGGHTVNPSATAGIGKSTVSGLYINQFEMAEYFSFGMSTLIKDGYQLGVHGVNLSIDNVFERPDINNISNLETRRDSIRKLISKGLKSFSTRESALFFNISRQITIKKSRVFSTIPIGLNIKLIQKDLYESKGRGIGLDFGGMLKMELRNIEKFDWLDRLIIGASLNNIINTTIYWDSGDKDKIPMQLIGGIAYLHQLRKLPIRYTLLWQRNTLYTDDSQYGAEITLFDIISLRGGHNYGYLQGGLGLNIKYKKYVFGIDYSFSDHDLGNAHRIGGWISF